MKRMTTLLLAICIASLTACATTPGSGHYPDASGAIKAVLDTQVVAWNKGDLEGFMIGYHKSPDMRFAANNKVSFGWQGALDSYKKAYTDTSKMGQLTFSELDIQMLSADTAMVFGRFTQKVPGEPKDPTGLFTLIFKNTAAGWRIIHDHSSDSKEKKPEVESASD